MNYEMTPVAGGVPIKSWTRGVPFDPNALRQLRNVAHLPFIHRWVAVMPDVHVGKGATIGSVIPTVDAIIPAAVGVDIGCGMIAVRTDLSAADLPDHLFGVRTAIEEAVPHGRVMKRGRRDPGAWGQLPERVVRDWRQTLLPGFKSLCEKHPVLEKTNNIYHLGTLGTGNHFIELCQDETQRIWAMLHSGSRGVGNRIGTYFIELAKEDMRRQNIHLPDRDLAYFREGSRYFEDYVEAVAWAQHYARLNREIMMAHTLDALARSLGRPVVGQLEAVNCHHNYVKREYHYGRDVWVTRKGAVSARRDELGIIPGSMGARSFIVRGLGNTESFCSCSHGAGRVMSRTEAKRRVSLEQHMQATAHVECRRDADVVDETPAAYKNIDQVMTAQKDLVEVVHTLRQLVCVKG